MAGRTRRTDTQTPEGADTKPSQPLAPTAAGASDGSAGDGHARRAARAVNQQQSITISLPFVGEFGLPPAPQMAYIAGVGGLAVLGAIEWPVAVALGLGHFLASQHNNAALEEFGEALDEA